ncbi:MAG: glycosyltransferase family 39 protein [Fibromonadaceae bacterium]|jgi:uncharacterized membrane protein|nr:glycosyltransferase family 39 protein [Fibromonadaceae bacterium]
MKRNIFDYGFATLIVLFFCLNTFLSTGADIWLDEAYSLIHSSGNFREIIKVTSNGVHPQLFYFILSVWQSIFAHSIFAAKMLSVVFMSLALIVISLFLRKEFSSKTSFVFCLYYFVPFYIIYNSIEIRMYSLAFLFVNLACISLYYIAFSNKKKWWFLFLFFAVASAYTHYYAAVLVAIVFSMFFVYISLKDRSKIKYAILTAFSAIVLYMPWFFTLLATFGRVKDDYWIPEVTLGSTLVYLNYAFENVTNKYSLVIVFAISIIFFFIGKKRKKEKIIFGASLSYFSLALFGILISIFVKPIFIGRYLFPSIALIFMFLAVELCKIKNKVLFTSICILLFVFAINNSLHHIQIEQRKNERYLFFYNTVSKKFKPEDIFVFHPSKDLNTYGDLFSYIFPKHTQFKYYLKPEGVGENYLDAINKFRKAEFIENLNKNKIKEQAVWILLKYKGYNDDWFQKLIFYLERQDIYCNDFLEWYTNHNFYSADISFSLCYLEAE